jgi:hypothetical protein
MAHLKADNTVECEWCFEMVELRKLPHHRETECEGRTVSCRFPGCGASFRAWERGEHEQFYCEYKKQKERTMKLHARQAVEAKETREVRREEEEQAVLVQQREAREKVLAFYKEAEYKRKKRAVIKEQLEKDRKAKEEEEREAERREAEKVKLKRNMILGAAKMKLQQEECPQCAAMVMRKDMSKHLKFFCPYGTLTCELCNAKVRKMNWELHSKGVRPACFECGKRPEGEPCIYQSRRKIQTVVGDLGPVPPRATQKLTQLAMQLQQRPNMRPKILATFIDTEEDICKLEIVDEVLHASTGGFVVDWSDFLLQLLQLSKDMMVCEQAGRVGRVRVADVSICYECWAADKLAPLTGKEQYVRREVCPQVFLTQSMLARRAVSAAVQGWECRNGCGADKFASKTDLKLHMEESCPRRIVSCVCGGCPARFPLAERVEHEQQCPYYAKIQNMSAHGQEMRRMVYCGLGCGEQLEIRRVDVHEAKLCKRRYVDCEKGCGAQIMLFDMKRHVADDCQAPSEVARRKMIANARRKYLETEKSHSDPMVHFFAQRTLDPESHGGGASAGSNDDGDDD